MFQSPYHSWELKLVYRVFLFSFVQEKTGEWNGLKCSIFLFLPWNDSESVRACVGRNNILSVWWNECEVRQSFIFSSSFPNLHSVALSKLLIYLFISIVSVIIGFTLCGFHFFRCWLAPKKDFSSFWFFDSSIFVGWFYSVFVYHVTEPFGFFSKNFVFLTLAR